MPTVREERGPYFVILSLGVAELVKYVLVRRDAPDRIAADPAVVRAYLGADA